MKTIQAIRIEHPSDGNGMFCTKNDIYDIKELKSLCERHFYNHSPNKFPSPLQDGLDIYKGNKRLFIRKYKEWFCAFKTIQQLNSLFYKEELQVVLKHGFDIFLIEVEEYQEGEYQILYTKESIKKKQNINQLFK